LEKPKEKEEKKMKTKTKEMYKSGKGNDQSNSNKNSSLDVKQVHSMSCYQEVHANLFWCTQVETGCNVEYLHMLLQMLHAAS